MLEIHSDECDGRDNPCFFRLSPGLGVFESDGFPVISKDSVVGDASALHVWGEVFEAGHAVADVFAVGDPMFVPCGGGDKLKKLELFQGGAHFAADENGERFGGDQEVMIFREQEVFAVRGDAAAGCQEMNMRVVFAVAPPGLESTEKSDFGAEIFGIRGQFLNRFGGGLEQRVEYFTRMRPAKRMEFMRQCDGDHEIVDRQDAVLLFSQEFCHFVLSAFGAVTVAAGRPREVFRAAFRTGVKIAVPHRRGPASTDIADRMTLLLGHAVRINVNVVAKNIGDLRQGVRDRSSESQVSGFRPGSVLKSNADSPSSCGGPCARGTLARCGPARLLPSHEWQTNAAAYEDSTAA